MFSHCLLCGLGTEKRRFCSERKNEAGFQEEQGIYRERLQVSFWFIIPKASGSPENGKNPQNRFLLCLVKLMQKTEK